MGSDGRDQGNTADASPGSVAVPAREPQKLAALIEQQIISLQSRIAKLKHLAAEEEPGSAS
jgi:hypothetical protein